MILDSGKCYEKKIKIGKWGRESICGANDG